MLMKKIYSFLMVLALMCISTVARAEVHTANITSDPENDYYSGYVAFPIADIVAELGLENEAALATLIENGGAVYIQTADGDRSNAYTGNTNEFWMDANGSAVGYADGVWFAGLYYDPVWTDEESGETYEAEFYTRVGQMPGYFGKIFTDTDLSCTLYLVNGEKVATFNVNLHVNASEGLPLSSLNIVKDYTFTLPFIVGKSYEGKTYSTTLEGVYEALNMSAEDLDSLVSTMTYAQIATSTYDSETDITTYSLSDNLLLPEDAAAGAWFGRYINVDEATDKDIPLSINAPMGWGTGCTFYTQEITLADGEFSIVSGQYPGTFKEGDNDSTYLYIVNGTTAVRIKVQVEIEAAPVIDPNDMVQVGETTVQVSAVINNNHATKRFSIDMDAICEALGCTIDDIDDVYTMNNGSISDQHNENSGGYYYNEEGVITDWGNGAAFFIGISDIQGGKFTVGQRADYFTEITEPVTVKAQLVFQYLTNYYIVNVEYTVVLEEEEGDDHSDWTQVYAEAYDVQLIAAEGYAQDESCKTYLDLDAIAAAIGTDDPVLYGESWNGDKMTFSDAHSCDPKPGFWMASDGISVGFWGSGAAYGMTYKNGVITYYTMDDNSVTTGASFESRFYLVNEENGKYAKITLFVEYVDERGTVAGAIGEADVVITVAESTMNGDALYEGNIEWSEVLSALEITEDDIEGCIWMVQNQSGKLVNFGTASSFFGEEAIMDKNGYNTENSDDAVFSIGYDFATQKLVFSLFGEEPEEGVLYQTKIALKSDAGYYVFNVTAASEATITGINGVAAPKAKAGNVYDINGRKVSAPANGIYIIDGVKVYVK